MKKFIRQGWPVYAVLTILVVALAIGGCQNQPPPLQGTNYTVGIASKGSLGDYLVDHNNKALYYYAKDTVGTSNASGVLLDVWPVFYAANLNLPTDLNPADFGTITRPDGKKQTTYHGWPLYTYAADVASGDTFGDGFEGIWFVVKVPFYTVMVESKADVGTYLIDPKGMALYHADFDVNGKSNATSAILALWPIFSQSNFIVPSSLNSVDFNIIRTGEQVQVTYKGWPLYYFINDKAPGDTLGQGVKNVWSVTDPKVTTAPSTPISPVP
jgi:predicted lipoprotein with Yx(FWY)xxD motif